MLRHFLSRLWRVAREEPTTFRTAELLPPDVCEAILSAFRWRGDASEATEGGLEVGELTNLLFDAPQCLIMDWRGEQEETLEELVEALSPLGVELQFQYDHNADAADLMLRSNGFDHSERVPRSDSNLLWFESTLRTVQRCFPDKVEFRWFGCTPGDDTWIAVALAPATWQKLDKTCPSFVKHACSPFAT